MSGGMAVPETVPKPIVSRTVRNRRHNKPETAENELKLELDMVDRNPVGTFLDLEERLRGKCPAAIREAKDLSGRIIEVEEADTVDSFGAIAL